MGAPLFGEGQPDSPYSSVDWGIGGMEVDDTLKATDVVMAGLGLKEKQEADEENRWADGMDLEECEAHQVHLGLPGPGMVLRGLKAQESAQIVAYYTILM